MSDLVEGMRVVLPEGRTTARVWDGARWHDDLPLLTVLLAEDEEAAMAAERGDAVLLKERWPTAFVRVDGAWHAGVPVYRARRHPDGREEEVRVRVDALRPVRAEGEASRTLVPKGNEVLQRFLGE